MISSIKNGGDDRATDTSGINKSDAIDMDPSKAMNIDNGTHTNQILRDG